MAYENEMDDGSPWVPDKPPPSNLSEDYLREEIKSAKNGIGGLLMIGFSVARTIQVFSRVPGTAGVTMLMIWMLGIGLQAAYLIGHEEKFGQVDATECVWLIVAQLGWWTLGAIRELFRTKRQTQIAVNEPGRGVLCRLLPFVSHDMGGAISDVVIGALLVVGLHAVGSPIQAGTYQVILGLTVFCHLCVFGQRLSYRLRVNAARKRARNWKKDVRGRHYV